MPQTDQSHRSRAADALRALDTGADLEKRRIWRRVQLGLAEEQLRARRRFRWIAGIAASAVAALVLVLPSARDAAYGWAEPSRQDQQRVAIDAVMEMINGQQAHAAPGNDTSGVGDFANYIVTEAHPGAE